MTYKYPVKKGKKKTFEQIKIARLDISKKYDFIKTEGFPDVGLPKLFVYYDGDYHPYTGHSLS